MQYVKEPNDDCCMDNLGKQLRSCKVKGNLEGPDLDDWNL
jgi:hypothetical protein